MEDLKYETYTVRHSEPADLGDILKIYEGARSFMRESGNPNQWGSDYPPDDMIRDDIAKENSLVIVAGSEICGVFCCFEGEDPTYAYIENGSWKSSEPYVTIHRIAAKRGKRGILKTACDYARTISGHLRADTHEMNAPMRKALTRYGFLHCGTIYVRDGRPRLAFEYIGDKIVN